MRNWIITALLLVSYFGYSQELNCTVKVNYDQITAANVQIFKTLERSLGEFVNNTKWTTRNFANKERIDCSMFITIQSYESNEFTCTLQIQSSRPVYNSTYGSPVFNFNDKEFNFRYLEFENFVYNPNSYDSNLIAVVAFYANIIIGLDADTFSSQGGTKFIESAANIANLAQSSGAAGWTQTEKKQNRYYLVNDLLSNTFTPYREALYEYHFLGMDKMADKPKEAKENIVKAIQTVSKIHNVRPNAFITRIFFDAKADEIVAVFSGGPNVNIAELSETLNRVSPLNSAKWNAIKF
ncbi:uncharacterized protein DUF4835 [Flavobacterium cauense R2A-7]|uniref:Uncharacterized protein DUF4835 n=1 Tax=Flavobacterium cauense R2A-7 TaxID=1341154 RepID=A0A562M529_9FLAO|nr:DUF4835 family protein [Flavobacterium cauense]KGO82098.1 hypothetical protein Q762_05210 [Flavobacterium cauense R2A-7]TWI15045.1 uncharacterized protein DUF4835 [Flavobacterium cauense R2A-7]